ncbi:hypothetical protein CLV27_0145 [Phorcysia thermohydrogeniphila]|uniref:Uncharacterized protein n=1 Tax=Phorcysia thermohydrogeniphila TaxID=936138 RepID=A0A4R1GDY4_9BACT|nr:hypothetical protein CLV27_0145 [Phorcysia thermohydrogeniphila]
MTLKYLTLYHQLLNGMNYLRSSYKKQGYIKVSDLMNFYSVPLFKFIQTFIYITLIKSSAKAPQVIKRGYYFIIPPGAVLSYKHHGFCMNHDRPAPVWNDRLRLEPISKIGIPSKLLPVLKCVILNKEKLNNPQGLVWFLVEIDKIPYSELIKGRYSYHLRELEKVCPGSREVILSYKRSQIPKELFVALLKQLKIKVGYKTYTLDELVFNPNVTQKLLNELIQRGKELPGPKGAGYSEILKEVYAKSVGISPLTGKVEILNFSDKPISFSPLDYYLQPAAKKQRISPVADIQDVYAHFPLPSESEVFYQKVICSLVKIAKKIFGEIFPEKGDKLLKELAEKILEREDSKLRKFLGKEVAEFLSRVLKETPIARGMGLYESLCGKSFLFCEPLSCKDRAIAFVTVFSPTIADTLAKIAEKVSYYVEAIENEEKNIVIDRYARPIVDFFKKCDSYSGKVTMPVCDGLCITTWFKGDPFSREKSFGDVISSC